MLVGVNNWRKDTDGTWHLTGTTTRGATIHWIDNAQQGDSFRLHGEAQTAPVPRLVCFKVPGGKVSMGARGFGRTPYPALFEIGRILEQREGWIRCEFICEFPVVGQRASGK